MEHSLRVLLIESHPKDAHTMQKILEGIKTASIRLEKAKNLSDALEVLSKGGVDAILLDNSLPDGRGLDNLVKVQAIAKEAPVIVLSDKDDSVSESEAIFMGAQDFLIKDRMNAPAMARVIHYAIERQKIRMTLENAVAKLQELNQMKSDFISSVSHELHTPLTIITVAVNNFLDGIFGDMTDLQMHWLGRVLVSTERLTNLINDILDLSKLEAGRVKLNWKKFDIVRVILETIEEVSPLAQKRGMVFKNDIPPGPIMVYAAGSRITQVLVNLLTNAIKYTQEGGEINVKVAREKSGTRVEVADNGQGIDPTKLDVVFERFLQLGHDKTTTPGIGLGLAICKEIISLHQGRIWAESGGTGKGSHFIFTLPLDLESKSHSKPTVLAVDNDPAVLELLVIVLKELGCDVIEAKDGAEAIAYLLSNGKNSPIDLLVTDMMLPVRNGAEIIQEAMRVNPETVIAVVTGFPDNKVLIEAMRHGNITLIRKPFSYKDIKKALVPLVASLTGKETVS